MVNSMVSGNVYRQEDVIKLLKALKDGSISISDISLTDFDVNIHRPYYIPRCLLINCETTHGTGCLCVVPIKNYTNN